MWRYSKQMAATVRKHPGGVHRAAILCVSYSVPCLDPLLICRFFWHHLMRKAFTSHAVFVVSRVLRLPRQSQVSRYLVIVVTFLISAVLHVASSGNYSFRCSVLPQVRFYMSIVAVIIVEDVVIKTYKLARSKGVGKEVESSGLWYFAGYVWTACFMVWATSKLLYQSISCIP